MKNNVSMSLHVKSVNKIRNIKIDPEKLIVVLGPTASGKSELAINLAKKYNGEVISADSRQIYKNLDIGTGKITKKEMQGIKHHLLSFLNPDKDFSVAEFQDKANEKIKDIFKKKKTPIICGGTGLYIDALVNGFEIPRYKANEEFRQKMEKMDKEEIFELLSDELKQKHKEMEKRKMIRALEILHKKGMSKKTEKPKKHDAQFIGINWDRKDLYKRINLRTKKMFEDGILDECRQLIKNHFENTNAASSLGYKEGILFLKNEIGLEEAISISQKRARNYAKRQITWFKKNNKILWIPGEILDQIFS